MVNKIIKDFWILTETGLVLFHRQYTEMDPNLFGAMMSAINSYTKMLYKEGLHSFELSEKRFSLFKKDGLIFIANSSRKIKEPKVLEEIRDIAEKFFYLYPKEFIQNWAGDVSVFNGFEDHITDSLNQKLKKFQEAFW